MGWDPGQTQLQALGCLHVEVGEVEPSLLQQVGYEVGPPWRVLHHHPVQVLYMEEGVGQTGQLSFLHWPGVGRGDNKDGWQGV